MLRAKESKDDPLVNDLHKERSLLNELVSSGLTVIGTKARTEQLAHSVIHQVSARSRNRPASH